MARLVTSMPVNGASIVKTAFWEVSDTGTVMFVHFRAEAAVMRVKRAKDLIIMTTV